MTITLSVQSDTNREQRLLMPGTYNWQQLLRCVQMPSRLEAMKAFMAGVQHG